MFYFANKPDLIGKLLILWRTENIALHTVNYIVTYFKLIDICEYLDKYFLISLNFISIIILCTFNYDQQTRWLLYLIHTPFSVNFTIVKTFIPKWWNWLNLEILNLHLFITSTKSYSFVAIKTFLQRWWKWQKSLPYLCYLRHPPLLSQMPSF